MQLVTDDAQPPRHTGAAAADVDLARRIVKVNPFALARGDDALRTQHDAIFGLVLKRGERGAQTVLGELLRRLHAPGREHLIRVVAVVMVMMAAAALVIVMVVLMVVAAAALVLVVVLIVVVVMMLVLMPVVILVIVVMAAAGAAAVFIEMMMVLVLFVLVVVMMVMLVLVLVLFVLALNAFKRGGEGVALFHRVEDLRAGELVPRRRDDDGAGILLAQQRDALGELFLA